MIPVIEIESVSKKFSIEPNRARYRTLRESISTFSFLSTRKDFWALRDISFSMEQGEIMGVIGENGAGKTTLLKILSRITKPTSGRGVVRGRTASLLEVGTGFHSELTGRENIYLNGVILGLTRKEIDRKYDAIVEFSGVKEFLNTPIKHYSTGMWARLAFSVAAHLDAGILLIDEVLSVGDVEFQKRSLAKMNELSGSGRTVIFVSHNMAAVQNLCTRCMLLGGGRIMKTGTPGEVIEEYMSAFSREKSGVADLTKHEGRKGSQKAFIKRIELRNQHDVVTGTFCIRDDLHIHLFLESPGILNSVKIIVDISESTGERVCSMYDSDSGFSLKNVHGDAHVSLELKDIRLVPGRYHISVSLGSEIFNYKMDCYDELDRAISFDVENHLIIDRALSRRGGLILLTPGWKRY